MPYDDTYDMKLSSNLSIYVTGKYENSVIVGIS